MVCHRARISGVLLTLSALLLIFVAVRAQPPIALRDSTPKGHVVAENVLGDPMSIASGSADGTVKYALLNSTVASYFRVDELTGRLVTRRPIDRDMLCLESGLCCAQNTQNPRLSSVRPADNGDAGTVCALRLDVAVTVGRNTIPSTRQVYVEVMDENDHSPMFSILTNSPQYEDFSNVNYGSASSIQVPILVLNISEAATVGSHRLTLPLATDLDAAPFNVQKYILESGGNSRFLPSSASSPERFFKLDIHKRELGTMSQFEAEAPITGLDLLLIAPLDRESRSVFEFNVLAIDGGTPIPKTGTLSVQIRVTDANDHEPVFERSSYEKEVEEGQVFDMKPILKVVAHDEDEGVNARIRYSWWPDFERFGPDANLLLDHRRLLTDEEIASTVGSAISPEHLARLQALPSYWFRLDERTGEIFVHRPLDYETKRGFVFAIVATNPDADDPTGQAGSITRKSLKNSLSMTKVVINVINLNDEKPQISIDYVINNDSVKHKQVMENNSPDHFIALIRATDADASSSKLPTSPLDDFYQVQTSGFQYSGSHPRSPHSSAGGLVTCELGSHTDNYTLLHNTQTDITSGMVEYVLKTQTPLDREREQRQFVIIRCFDDGTPSKTSTATVEVEILDQNDCVPEIAVHGRVPSSHRAHQSNVVSPIPRSRLADILQKASPDWQKLQRSLFVEHPLVNAYEAGIPVVLVNVPENRPAGTIVASLRGIDQDAGENGRVTFRILKADRRLPRVIPGTLPPNQRSGQYPEGKFDPNLPPVIIRADAGRSDLFKLETNGDITTNRVIDREQSSPIQDELYLFLEAQDWGQPKALTSYVLLAIEIEDENDNPPTFVLPHLNFHVLENLSAPRRIGEILVQDADAGVPREKYYEAPSNPLRVSKPPKHSINLFINPGHGRPDLPFVIDATPDGRFFLNVTRTLDREVDESFGFLVLASDYGGHFHLRHTSTATITVSVIDVNDNAPEIIFPKPTTATNHVHALSYLEMPDTEILSVNANDKDPKEENGKLVYELGSVITSLPGVDPSKLAKNAMHGDLFKIDPFKGLLKTQRRMNEDDIGEHWLQLIVRDTGTPPQETRQVIRLAVDRSPPQFASNVRSRIPPHQRPPSGEYSGNNVLGPLYRSSLEWNGVSGRSVSDMVLVISLVIAGFIVLIGLCFYLRYHQKLFLCLPDVCALFQKPQSSPNPYSNPECVERPVKSKEGDRKVPKKGSFQGRVWTPLPAPPLEGGEFIVSSPKCNPNPAGGGAFVSIANGTSRCQIDGVQSAILDGSDFFERTPKLYTDCYHVGIPANQGPIQSSRFFPIPAGSFKSVVSPNDDFSVPKSNFYNSATVAVQPAAISPLHQTNFVTSSCRYGETLPLPSLYVPSGGVINPQHCQVPLTLSGAVPTMARYPDGLQQQQTHQNRPSRSKTLDSAAQQGSCDLLSYSNSLSKTRFAVKAGHYKSEPALAACDDLKNETDDEFDDPSSVLISNGNGGACSDDYLGDSRCNFGKKISATPPPMAGQTLENYAVSFPKPQASYV
ncbi:hypothetical protein Aperf_G00000075521 [Anoplocephala perfoliata]